MAAPRPNARRAAEGSARAANADAVARVRRLLADEGGGRRALARLLADFRELVAGDGPLPFVRFPPAAFAGALARHAAAAAAAPTTAGDAGAALAARCLEELAPAASEPMRRLLRDFLGQSFVPACDRDAAVAALLTWDLGDAVPAALWAIFAAQLEDVGADERSSPCSPSPGRPR